MPKLSSEKELVAVCTENCNLAASIRYAQYVEPLKALNLNYISLFCGCGGFDDGFESLGYNCIGAYDNNLTVLEVYKQNLPGPTYKQDLSDKTLDNFPKGRNIDLVLSGSPCQGFSTAGSRNINDPRNALLLRGGEIALEISPKVFVAENVMGSISGSHKKFWSTLVTRLKKGNYKTEFILCDGQKIGLAQTRKRVMLVAWKGNKRLNTQYMSTTPQNLEGVISNINHLPNQDYIPVTENIHFNTVAEKIGMGQKLCNVRGGSKAVHTWNIPEAFGHTTEQERELLHLIMVLRRKIRRRNSGDADPVHILDLKKNFKGPVKPLLSSLLKKKFLRQIGNNHYDLQHAFNGLYRRLSWDEPSYTVDTQFGNPRHFIHPSKNRGFTVREAARIQGFRDDFIFSGPIKEQFKMIGNAVPPPMGRFIGNMLLEQIFN